MEKIKELYKKEIYTKKKQLIIQKKIIQTKDYIEREYTNYIEKIIYTERKGNEKSKDV